MYEFDNPMVNKKAEQEAISNMLIDLKNKYKDKILLISIAGDINMPSIELLKKQYNITKLPVVLFDEKIKFETLDELKEIEKYIK